MSGGEYNSLMKNGNFQPYDKAMEGKWFATNPENAAKWGETFYPNGDFKMVEVTVPKSSLEGMYYGGNKLDGIGSVYYAERDYINQVLMSIRGIDR